MDGNGRWALARGLPRAAGHREGVETVSRIVEAAPGLGIGVLTLFAFSSDNWQRPAPEVEALMALLWIYLAKETPRCLENGIRMEIIGRRDRLDESLRRAIERTEAATAHGRRLRLRMAIDYSAREAILAAARETSPLIEGVAQRRAGSAGGPADPHRRRAAAERFSAVGMRLRGVCLLAAHVAGIWRGRSGVGGSRVSRTAEKVRRRTPCLQQKATRHGWSEILVTVLPPSGHSIRPATP